MDNIELVKVLQEMVIELKGINEKLNYMCTQGLFVKIDEDISEN